MPLILWVPVRIVRAFVVTGRLLLDHRLMRSLPWGYIRTLPRTNVWIGIATLALAVTLLAIPLTLLLPVKVGSQVYFAGILCAIAGIVSSAIRTMILNRRARG
jgi:hypothetical protein